MPLYLATHTVEVVTAKVLPTSDTVSISLWDAPAADELLEWLNTNLQYDAAHAVHEVQEDFSWGYTFELTRLRAADKVVAGGRGAYDRLSATAARAGDGITKQLEVLDQRTHILTAAEHALQRVKAAANSTFQAATTSTAAAPGATAADGSAPAVPTTSATISANMTALGTKATSTFSWLGSALKEQIKTATNAVVASTSTTAGTGYAAQPSAQMDAPIAPNVAMPAVSIPPQVAVISPTATPVTASRQVDGVDSISQGLEDVSLAQGHPVSVVPPASVNAAELPVSVAQSTPATQFTLGEDASGKV